MTDNNNDHKCAPNKIYSEGSCFNKQSLKLIIKSYDKIYNTQYYINNQSKSKKELVKLLKTLMKKKCNDQMCWIRDVNLDMANSDENSTIDDIKNYTFLPEGPKEKYGWLSNFDISNVIKQYVKLHEDFMFLGAVPSDFEEVIKLFRELDFEELEKNGKYRFGLVMNLDPSNRPGIHWVGLYFNLKTNEIYYFDSVGEKPIESFKKFITRITKYLYKKNFNKTLPDNFAKTELDKYVKQIYDKFQIYYNTNQHQKKDSECGVYATHFIIEMMNNKKFDDVMNNIIDDKTMNEYRKKIFINAK